MKNFIIFSILILAFSPISSVLAIVAPSTEQMQQRYEDKKQQFEQNQDYYQGLLLNWDRIISNLQKEINRLQSRQKYRQELYLKVSKIVNNTLDELDQQGLDTSELRVLLDEFDLELQNAYAAMNEAITHLNAALNYARQHDIDSMVDELQQANASILKANQYYQNAYNIFTNEIVPILLELI